MPIINKINQLDEPITFYSTGIHKNEDGETEVITKKEFDTWAQVRTQYLNELRSVAVGSVLENTVTFVIRYNQPNVILNEWILKWKAQKYSIVAVNSDTANKKWTTIVAKVKG